MLLPGIGANGPSVMGSAHGMKQSSGRPFRQSVCAKMTVNGGSLNLPTTNQCKLRSRAMVFRNFELCI
jgi:hypothetical protein